MKRILVIGQNSYIGQTIKSFLISRLPTKDKGNQYAVAMLSVREDTWKDIDFWVCDSVLYCAGISDSAEHTREEYMHVNCDLAYEVASKCKADKVKQFIYLSSIDVYGLHSKIGKECVITAETPCKPKTLFAESKLMAEEKLKTLADDNFKVVIVRAPMVYGKGCPGEYNTYRSYALDGKPVPQATSKKSFLHIDNLCEYIKTFVDQEVSGIFCPQNSDIVTPLQFVEMIAQIHEREIKHQSAIANTASKMKNSMNTLWGGLIYEETLSDLPELPYISFEDSIRKSERE